MSKTLSLLIAAVSLAGCASLNSLTSEVSSYSQWPAERKPGSYAFERLPSQQTHARSSSSCWKTAPRPALEAAGFTPAADAKDSRVHRAARRPRQRHRRSIYDDPFWWRGGPVLAPLRPAAWGAGWRHGLRHAPLDHLRARGGAADPRPQERPAAVRGPRQQRRRLAVDRSRCCRRCSRRR